MKVITPVRRVASAISILIAGAYFGACQKFTPAPLSAASSAADFSSRSLSDPELRTYQAKSGNRPSGKIWTRRPVEAAAEFFQPEVAVARAKAATALDAITTADTAPNPSLSFSPEIGQSAGVPSPWVLGFSLSFPIETARKRQFRTAQARLAANSAALAVTEAMFAARSAARSVLLEMEATTRRCAILSEQAEDYAETVRGLRSLVDAGEVSRTDLLRTQSLQSRAELDLSDARRLSQTSSARLAAAIGVPVSALGPYDFSYGSLEKSPEIPSTSRLRKAAMLQRPDVLAALQDYAAADAALRLEIAKQYPDLNLSPGYQYDQGQSKWALGIGITLPIDKNLGPIRAATAKRAEAAVLFQQTQAKASGELDQALAEVEATRTRIAQLDGILASRQKEISLSEKLAATGETEASASILLKIQLRQDEISLLDARVALHQALGMLEDATRTRF